MEIHSTEHMATAARPMLPPRAPGLPIVGALPAFLRRRFEFLREARERNGDIFMLDLGLARWVILNHPQQVDYVLRDGSDFMGRAEVPSDVACCVTFTRSGPSKLKSGSVSMRPSNVRGLIVFGR